jgi:hypothetical protein
MSGQNRTHDTPLSYHRKKIICSMHRIFVFALLLVSAAASAQYNPGRKHRDVFPTYGNYERKGWIFSPMLTYTLPPLKQASQRLFVGSDEVYDVSYKAAGRFGIGIEAGRFFLIETSPAIHSVEFNLGIKTLRGVERFEAVLDDPNRTDPFVMRGDGDFTFNYATANIKANHVKQFSDYTFLQNSIGLNADYMFKGNMRYNDRSLPITNVNGEQFLIQAHYRIGFGFKIASGVIGVASIETPIITAIPWDDAKSTLHVFNSRYRPLIIRMSFLLLDQKSDRKCPPKGRKGGKSETLFGMLEGSSPW